MAECITLESGCTVEIIEQTDCITEVIEVGSSGGLPVINSNTSIYVSPAGSDVTGSGIESNPFATIQRALDYLNGYNLVGDITVTIQLSAGDFPITKEITCSHPRPEAIRITGATLTDTMIYDTHYVPEEGAYSLTTEFNIRSKGEGLGNRTQNETILENTFATRIRCNNATYSGSKPFYYAIDAENVRFPEIDNIAFIDDSVNQTNGAINALNSDLVLTNVGICGFGTGINLSNSTVKALNLAIAHNSGASILCNENSNIYVRVCNIAGSSKGISLGSGSQFTAKFLRATGCSNYTADCNYSNLTIDAEYKSVGCSGYGLYSYLSKIYLSWGSASIIDCTYGIESYQSLIEMQGSDIQKCSSAIATVDSTVLDLGDASFTNITGDTITATYASKVYITGSPALSFSPELNTLSIDGSEIFATDSTNININDAIFKNVSHSIVDLQTGSVETLDTTLGTSFKKTINETVTFNFSFDKGDGQSVTLYLTNGGSQSLTFNGVTWVDGSVPDLNVSGLDILKFERINSTTYGYSVSVLANISDELDLKEDKANKGAANGYASLDAGAKIPLNQIPDSVLSQMEYVGVWDADTNTPTIPLASTAKGDYYVVSVAGNTNIDGITDWKIGDWLISNGTTWDKIDNTDNVVSVAGKTGVVTLDHSTDLSNVGTNTHAQIDTFITNAGTIYTQDSDNVSLTGGSVTGQTQVESDYFALDLAAGHTVTQGQMAWNADEETIDIGQNGAILQVGQEIHYHVRNNSGVAISNGDAVMATGTIGASGRITVAKMNADGTIPAHFFLGVATEDIADGTDGKVTHFGKVRGIDTSSFSEGQVLYCDPAVLGGLTSTEPTAPKPKLAVAFVINVHATNGTVFIRANQGHDLFADQRVHIDTIADGQILSWNNTNSRFENTSSPFKLTIDGGTF